MVFMYSYYVNYDDYICVYNIMDVQLYVFDKIIFFVFVNFEVEYVVFNLI